ncbi:MAG: EamA family transporter RarD [Bacillota bacterium]
MKLEQSAGQTAGIVSAASAYIIWGFMPIYWKLIHFVPSMEVLTHRVVWSLALMAFVLLAAGKTKAFISEISDTARKPKQLLSLIFASFFITVNWLTFIWAVSNNRIIETSLGYYINPLVCVLFGVVVLKEKLYLWQTAAFVLAAIGVLNMTINYGSFPWAALVLAVSFGIYSLLKKVINLGAIAGITSETLIISPFAIMYLTYIHQSGNGAFGINSPVVSGYLIGAGIVTAVPLLLFSAGAIRLPLSTVGFLQYIAPTLALILGVFLYDEPFTAVHIVSFVFIWAALTIYSLSKTRTFIKLESIFLKAFRFRTNTYR